MLNAQALWLLTIIPLLMGLSLWRFSQSWKTYKALGGSPNIYLEFMLRYFSRELMIILAIITIILALTDSHWGETLIREPNSSTEIIFAIDISQSMRAEDASGERLQSAKFIAQELLLSLQEPRVGVVIFKGEAFTALPITNDKEMVTHVLESLDVSWLSYAGSNIADALKESRGLFSPDNQAERIIVLFSDGEVTTGNTKDELRKLFHNNIKVFSVGLGTVEGAIVPDAHGSPRINSHGEFLQSSLNPSLLKNIAYNSNGNYFWAGDPQTIESLKKILKQNENKKFRMTIQRRSLFNFFVILAIIFLSISQIIRSLPWTRIFGARDDI
ncbi:VWA domain-containing protein [Entomospira entomophila]|uniref:VWA domain-containing protein n=1 Tax=Entomospira entomophila TaxID=2719988 RepID=A0A968GE03_9SPIO|nr:VWA domain-containing protein [Entomospira entomophilus]NIZ40699.1 VWA domain-containing protein [Entomospira entomophilus]WDI34912.1 VWA domain-containing protein [Entomospira entomophilus]